MSVEWRRREAFAEFAEALGIATDQIMATRVEPGGERVTVLYTIASDEDAPDDEPIYRALLVRGEDGVFKVTAQTSSGTLGEVRRHLGL